jgi:hypothetical protein
MPKKRKAVHSARASRGDSSRAVAAHKRWLRHQIKVSMRTLRKKGATDSEHSAAMARLRKLEHELAGLAR